MMVMLGHGLVSGALFLCVGVIYDRLHTREIDRYGGLAINMPRYAALFMLFTMASIGLPGTSNFVGEFLALVGTYQVSTLITLLCTTGIILGAAYMLYLYRRVVFGDLTKDDVKAMPDLSMREILCLAPIAAVVLVDGRLSRKLPEADARRCRSAGRPRRTRHARGGFAADPGPRRARAQGGGALMNTFAQLQMTLPEEVLGTGALLLMLIAAWGGQASTKLVSWAAVAVLIGAGVSLFGPASAGGTAFGGLYHADMFAAYSPRS